MVSAHKVWAKKGDHGAGGGACGVGGSGKRMGRGLRRGRGWEADGGGACGVGGAGKRVGRGLRVKSETDRSWLQ